MVARQCRFFDHVARNSEGQLTYFRTAQCSRRTWKSPTENYVDTFASRCHGFMKCETERYPNAGKNLEEKRYILMKHFDEEPKLDVDEKAIRSLDGYCQTRTDLRYEVANSRNFPDKHSNIRLLKNVQSLKMFTNRFRATKLIRSFPVSFVVV